MTKCTTACCNYLKKYFYWLKSISWSDRRTDEKTDPSYRVAAQLWGLSYNFLLLGSFCLVFKHFNHIDCNLQKGKFCISSLRM